MHVDGLAGIVILILLLLAVARLLAKRQQQHQELETLDDEPMPEVDTTVSDVGDDELPEEVRRPLPQETMVAILRTSHPFEADLLRNLLIDRGIYAYVDGRHASSVFIATGLASTTLLVPSLDEQKARRFVAEARREAEQSGSVERRRSCPGCDYNLRATETNCPECGLKLG
jgi:hypothetical protein